MNFEDKKLFALQFIRLGIDPYQAMLHTDFTDEEIELASNDETFQSDIVFENRMEEIELLRKLEKAMDVAVQRGNSTAVQWKLERMNPRWSKMLSSKMDDPLKKEDIVVYLPDNGRNPSDDT